MRNPAWRWIAVLAIVLVIALAVVTLVPAAALYREYISAGTLVLALIALIAILVSPRSQTVATATTSGAAPSAPDMEQGTQAEAEIVNFVAMLQEKGRLIDFLMDDINPYDDSQVGAAARVVHAGCKTVLQEHFQIVPVRQESEGSTIQVPRGYQATEYRLVGKIAGKAPFSGVLVHRGWKTLSVKLPRILRAPRDSLPTLAPAEVELR